MKNTAGKYPGPSAADGAPLHPSYKSIQLIHSGTLSHVECLTELGNKVPVKPDS